MIVCVVLCVLCVCVCCVCVCCVCVVLCVCVCVCVLGERLGSIWSSQGIFSLCILSVSVLEGGNTQDNPSSGTDHTRQTSRESPTV